MRRIGIAGAGVLGRLLAYQLGQAGHQVTVFDPAAGPQPPLVHTGGVPAPGYAAGFTAAGLLSPLAPLEFGNAQAAYMGWRGLTLWRHICRTLPAATDGLPLMRQRGSLMVAHPSAPEAAALLLARWRSAQDITADWPAPRPMRGAALQALEPAMAEQLDGWLLSAEAQILPRETLHQLCLHAQGVDWRWGTAARTIGVASIELTDGSHWRGDWAVDCRGAGAGPDETVDLVQGQALWLHAPHVSLVRPLRQLHATLRLDLVPRPGGIFIVSAQHTPSHAGSQPLPDATQLLTMASALVPALADAHVMHLETNLRPARQTACPQIRITPGLLRITGLHHYGWLLAPTVVDEALPQLALLGR